MIDGALERALFVMLRDAGVIFARYARVRRAASDDNICHVVMFARQRRFVRDITDRDEESHHQMNTQT